MMEAMRAADTALIVVSGRDGVAVGTEKAFAAAEKNGLARSSSSTACATRAPGSTGCSKIEGPVRPFGVPGGGALYPGWAGKHLHQPAGVQSL